VSETPDPPRRRDNDDGEPSPESLAEVLASIRALVSAETNARIAGVAGGDVILLRPELRVDGAAGASPGDVLAEGIGEAAPRALPAPALDEAALREMINAIVREELQGELGERIGRNLRKLIRREIAELLHEARQG
jgi:hypothetical protein